jgi:CBS domain-containing protein
LQDCMRLMTAQRIRHLPVVEAERVIGMISIGDLVKAVIEEQQQTIEQLEHYIHH